MLNKKDNHDIFKKYKQVLLEQVEDNGVSSLLNKIKSSSLDPKTKNEILDILNHPTVQDVYKIISLQKQHGEYDADAAGYASYPDAKPAEQDDQDTVNDETRDNNWAKEMRDAQKDQNKKYPEQNDEDEMPKEAPWWVPGEANKQRWLETRQAHWKQAQKEKEETDKKTT